MSHRRTPYAGKTLARRLIETLLALSLPLLLIFVVVPLLQQQHEAELAEWRAQEQAASEAALAPFQRAFASGDIGNTVEFCEHAIDSEFSYVHPPQALAWAPDRIDAFVYVSDRRYGLHRVSCTATGIEHGRIDHPYGGLIPAEEGDRNPDQEALWSRLGAALQTPDADLRALELLLRPDDGTTVERRIRAGARGWEVNRVPADAPDFALLSGSPGLAVSAERTGVADTPTLPAPVRAHPQRRWSSAADDAFAFLDRELPADAKARIVGLRFDDDEIEVGVAAPVAGLDAAYGDIDFDAWGAATSWLYPRPQPPGFGCAVGVPLAQIRAAFTARCAEVAGCKPATHFSIADYSCSGASNGRWNLHIQSAN